MTTSTLDSASALAVPARPHTPMNVYIALFAGIIAGSFAAILTRYALQAGAPPLVIAATRLTLAALVLTPFTLIRHWREIVSLPRRDFFLIAIAGVWMALNFVLWSASLEYVGILIATVLVTSSPIWTALIEVTFLKARFTKALLIGLAAVIAGNLIIAVSGFNDANMGSNPLLGGALAVSAAIAIAIQRTIGRDVRARLTVLPFIWLMYSIAAVTLIVTAFVTRTPLTGYSPEATFWMLMLTIFPQLIGHSSMNYALRYFPATWISLAIQIEPAIAAGLAFVLFAQLPTVLQVVGSAIIISGVAAATLGKQAISFASARLNRTT